MKSLEEATAAIQQINIIRHTLPEDGNFPNNPLLPVLLFQGALKVTKAKIVEDIFESNGWINAWQDSILTIDHYHSTSHEVLGVIQGSARLLLGGPSGIAVTIEKGDVIIIPAGVAHRNLDSENDFSVVGAYPEGQEYDMRYGKEEEHPEVDKNIRAVPLPLTDPVYGFDGPLLKNWNS
jgi:uncharacterized protein YjlB